MTEVRAAEGVADWRWLATQRACWLQAEQGGRRLWPARLAVDAQSKLAGFTAYVSQQGPTASGPSGLAVAMAFFGPPGAPPPEVWDTFVRIHGELAASGPDPAALNPFDLMLAFGCGWRRRVSGPVGTWGGRWEVAYAAMINQLQASVVATDRLLVDQLPQFALTEDDLLLLPGDFTLSLLGGCDCGHHRRGCGEACGRLCCFPRHDLNGWDPLGCHLRPFLDQAVRGTAAKQILGGAFSESLTYSALRAEGRILRCRVEFKRCPSCQTQYEEASCPTPGCEPPDGLPVGRGARANWLIHPEPEGGNYRRLVRWVCDGCGNLIPVRFRLREVLPADPCPVCGWAAPADDRPRTQTVWVRLFPAGPGADPYEGTGAHDDR